MTRTIDGTTYSLALTDTAGQEEYRGLWSSSNLHSDAFLLVYDITQLNSLEALEYFNQMIEAEREARMASGKVMPVCIVAGNKCDLQGMRQVKAADGLNWARSRGYGFMETSAREMVGIEETFARAYTPMRCDRTRTRITDKCRHVVLVRRVVEARRNKAQGITPALPSSTARTQPLPQAQNEKSAIPPGPGSHSQRPVTPQKTSFWSKMKCW